MPDPIKSPNVRRVCVMGPLADEEARRLITDLTDGGFNVSAIKLEGADGWSIIGTREEASK
jgi:hypothetical protein